MINAVLFDIDGTLVNSLPTYVIAYKEVLKSFGFELADKEIIKRCFGRTEEAICADLKIPSQAKDFRARYFAQTKKLMPQLKLFPDAVQTLKILNEKNIKIGIVSFAHSWYVEKISSQFNLDLYSQVNVSFNDVKSAKPAPDAVMLACNKLDSSASDTLIVGDTKSDILMGKNSGSKTALYTPKENAEIYNFKEIIKDTGPDFVIKTLMEIVPLVD